MTLNRTQPPAIKPFGKLSFPMPHIETLPNGIELYIIDKGDQEVCRLDFLFDGGRYAGTTTAIADLTGPMLRKGIPGMDNDAIAEHLEYHGAWLQTGTTQHYSTISFFSLNRNLDKVLPIVIAMITEPTLPEKPFEILRQQRIQQLSINRERVRILAGEAFNQLIFGANHPYARTTTTQDLEGATLDDLRQYHNHYYLNTTIRVVLSGRITATILATVKEQLQHLPASATPTAITPIAIAPENNHRVIIDKPGSLQSGIRIGQPTIGSKHSDFALLTLFNLILGGYFGSRLMTNIREEKGYTYGISSHLISMHNGAYFTVATEAGTPYTLPLIDEVYKEIETLRQNAVDEEEFETARNYLQGLRARALDSPFSMSDYIVSSLISGTPFNHFNQEDTVIRNATPQEVMRVARTYIDPNALYTAIAGDRSAIDNTI